MSENWEPFVLTEAECESLIQLTHASIAARINGETLPVSPADTPELQRCASVFVTLRIDGVLRGCKGDVSGRHPVGLAVQHSALSSAFEDPRFPPLSAPELGHISVEISVLSPMQPAQPEDVEVGLHGLVIRAGGRVGLLLPQVATDRNWNRTQFLDAVCYKAGLPEDTWQNDDSQLSTFTAQIFGEDSG